MNVYDFTVKARDGGEVAVTYGAFDEVRFLWKNR